MNNGKIIYFDNLRAFAISAVILLHSAAPLLYKYNQLELQYWWSGNLYDSLTRWCVPIFIMISGALLLDSTKQESALTFFRKRTSKVFIPFFAWTIIFILFNFFTVWNVIDITFTTLVRKVLEDDVYFHFGYLYMLIGLYIITPIIRVFILHASRRNIQYFLVLWFASTTGFNFSNKFFDINIAINMSTVSGYIGLFVLGYYIHNFAIDRKYIIILYYLCIISFVGTALGTYYLTKENKGIFDGYFYSYLSPNTIIISASLFLFFKRNNKINSAILSRLVSSISSTSFGIYLFHPIVLFYLQKYVIELPMHPIINIPLIAILIFFISYFVISAMRKIKAFKKIVP